MPSPSKHEVGVLNRLLGPRAATMNAGRLVIGRAVAHNANAPLPALSRWTMPALTVRS
jgi:hypothetical protein